jgi:hypothetical protein
VFFTALLNPDWLFHFLSLAIMNLALTQPQGESERERARSKDLSFTGVIDIHNEKRPDPRSPSSTIFSDSASRPCSRVSKITPASYMLEYASPPSPCVKSAIKIHRNLHMSETLKHNPSHLGHFQLIVPSFPRRNMSVVRT